YGGLFSMISAAANRYIGGLDEYDMRHLINAIAGFFAILFTGLLARRLGNWLTGLLALLLIASWPQFFGQSMNNPKDIPFALTYILTIYFLVKLVMELPRPSTRTWIMTAISIALAINIRVGGLLLIGMLFAFVIGTYILNAEKRKLISSSNSIGYLFTRLIFVAIAGYFGGLLFWPYGLVGPMSNPLSALKEQTNFAMGIGLLFEGKAISSREIPWYYIPKWLEITTPMVVMFGAIAQLVLWYFARKKFSSTVTLLIIFATLFPWAYAAYEHSPLYDGLRQFLFLIPLIAVLAALTWSYLLTELKPKAITYIVAFIFLSGLALPLRFSFANHPNEYVYFNEIIGGIKGANGKFNTDYYMNSVRKTAEWFKQSDMFKNANKEHKILLATNAVDPVNWYFRNDTDKVKIVYTKWNAGSSPKTRSARDWDYGIYYSRDVQPGMLISGSYPSDKAIYKNEADGVTLSCVIERKNKSDLYGYQEMQRDSLQKAEKYFEDALKYNPQNEEVVAWMVQVKLGLKKSKEALPYAQQLLQLNPNDDISYMMLGVCYAYTGDLSNSEAAFLKVTELSPMNYQAYDYLAQLYQQKGDNSTAQSYHNKSQEIKQQLQQQQQQ
ncbi:MAG: glycosyltransferase family 39 protein, partial [Bacteroidota bacterium]